MLNVLSVMMRDVTNERCLGTISRPCRMTSNEMMLSIIEKDRCVLQYISLYTIS